MFKITLEKTWMKKGVPTNYVKYLKVDKIEDVFKFYKLNDILEVQEC